MTAYLAPPQGAVFDDITLPADYDGTSTAESGAYDQLDLDGLWSFGQNTTQANGLQLPSPPHMPQGFALATAAAAAAAPSTESEDSPSAFDPLASFPMISTEASHMMFDPTCSMTMPDGSLPDFANFDGDATSACVGEYQVISPTSLPSLDFSARFPYGPLVHPSPSHTGCDASLHTLTSPISPLDSANPATAFEFGVADGARRCSSTPFSSQSPVDPRSAAWFCSADAGLQQPRQQPQQPQQQQSQAAQQFLSSPCSDDMFARQTYPFSPSFSFDSSYQNLFFGHGGNSFVALSPLDASYSSSNPVHGFSYSSSRAADAFTDHSYAADPSLLQPGAAAASRAEPRTVPGFGLQHSTSSTSPTSSSASASITSDPKSLKHSRSGDSTTQQPLKKSRSNSPHVHSTWQSYAPPAAISRVNSNPMAAGNGSTSNRSESSEAEDREKGRCPFPECGKIYKDLKAHILTHQTERPEKCPIPSCEWYRKGFSRKYDKNRHTLTHYKGTMVCGFCPGSGSAAEKSFNRADVFKRHLIAVHNVEQTPPNSRKKQSSAGGANDKPLPPGITGKCSICSQFFPTVQDFYEHLEDCVLEVVQKVDPAEAINEAILTSMADDKDTNDTIKRHAMDSESTAARDADAESDDEADDHDASSKQAKDSSSASSSIVDAKHGSRGPGVTYSAAGVPFHRQPRKRRKNYPNSWGCSADKMKMKKRVLAVFDGHNRLIKDDLMISSDFEVRMKLGLPSQHGQGDTNAYITDLDVETMRRANGFFQATDDERGPCKWTNVPGGNGQH